MGCTITLTGIELGCKDNVGGIKEVYIANKDNIVPGTITAGVIQTITKNNSEVFKKYYFRKQSGQMTSTAAISDQNGTIIYTTDLALKFNKMEAAKQQEIMQLAKGNLIVIALDNNGKYWYLGYDNEVIVSANVGATGTNMVDANGYDITFQDVAKQLPYEVKSSIISGLFS